MYKHCFTDNTEPRRVRIAVQKFQAHGCVTCLRAAVALTMGLSESDHVPPANGHIFMRKNLDKS